MSRTLVLSADANSADGGSTHDLLDGSGGIEIPTPTVAIPLMAGQVEPGRTNTDRKDEGRNVRGSAGPLPFRALPVLTFTCRLYDPIVRLLMPRALGRIGSPTGTAPAAVTTPMRPAFGGTILPSLIAWLVREDQVDKLTGLWIDQFVLSFAEAEPTIAVTARALYHEAVQTPIPLGFTPDFSDLGDPYAGVTLTALVGDSPGAAIDCFAGATITYNNHLSTDADVVFCSGQELFVEEVDGRYRRRQFPHRHRIGEQEITGNMRFGTTRPDQEDRALLASAERLVLRVFGNPLGTTPTDVDASLELEMPSTVITGGGADDFAREGEIKSNYDFGAFLDDNNEDLIARITGAAAITVA